MFDKQPGPVWDADAQDAWLAASPTRAVVVYCREHSTLLAVLEMVGHDGQVVAQMAVQSEQEMAGTLDDLQNKVGGKVGTSGSGTVLTRWWLEHVPDSVTPWCAQCRRSKSVTPERMYEALGRWHYERHQGKPVDIHV